MIFPVSIIGSPVLRKTAKDIDKDYKGLSKFIDDMFETMYDSDGVGLAAPQVGKSIRLVVIDATTLEEDDPGLKDLKKVMINAHMIERSGEFVNMEEGCLSIPGIREDVKREDKIRIEYYDENFEFHDEYFEGISARIIQHEYDHLDGVLFTDKISALRKRILKGKLQAISKGKFDAHYKVRLAKA